MHDSVSQGSCEAAWTLKDGRAIGGERSGGAIQLPVSYLRLRLGPHSTHKGRPRPSSLTLVEYAALTTNDLDLAPISHTNGLFAADHDSTPQNELWWPPMCFIRDANPTCYLTTLIIPHLFELLC